MQRLCGAADARRTVGFFTRTTHFNHVILNLWHRGRHFWTRWAVEKRDSIIKVLDTPSYHSPHEISKTIHWCYGNGAKQYPDMLHAARHGFSVMSRYLPGSSIGCNMGSITLQCNMMSKYLSHTNECHTHHITVDL